jgi:alpha-L-rhamnosidase
LPGFDDSEWQNAKKAETPRGKTQICEAEPIITAEILKPVSITPVKDGFLYDFGQNNAGVCRLKIDGKPGQELIIDHGEALENGELSLDNIIAGRFYPIGYAQRVRYICNGNGDYTPSFTYFGFRYAQISGITAEQATESLLEYHIMHSGIKERGGFSCSDETACKLQELTRRSTISNFYYFPTDCPHREKNGWTGDASLSAEHTLLNLQPEKSYSVWLDNIRAAQDERGALPGIVPTSGWGFQWGNGPAWDSVLVNLPYFTYIYRGDRKILEDNATAILRYLNYVDGRLNKKGLVKIGLGDWCHAGRQAGDPKAPLEVTDSITFLDICKKSAYIFGVLGMDLQRDFAQGSAEKVRNNIRKYLVDWGRMTVAGNCQTSQAMAIFYGVFENGERQAAFSVLKELIARENNHLDVGILGARVICHLLSSFGESDLAYEMITRPDFPSYGYWLKKGAASLFEDFRDLGEKTVANIKGSEIASLNHHMFGDISGWFIKSIAGINLNPYGNNINEVKIRPNFIKKLKYAEAFHIAPAGEIRVKWERTGEKITLTLKSPETLTGKITLPPFHTFEDGRSECLIHNSQFIIHN